MWRLAVTASACLLAAQPLVGAPAKRSDTADNFRSSFDQQIAASKSAMMTDPARALTHARIARKISRSVPGARTARLHEATALWLESEALSRVNNPAEAKPHTIRALALIKGIGENTKLHGDLLMTSAAIAGLLGEVQTAVKQLHTAYEIFGKLNERRSQALALHDIGSIYAEAGDYPRVLRYYRQAEELYSADPAISMTLHNNIAMAYREMKQLADAEREFRKALVLARKAESPFLQANILINLATAQLERGKIRAAEDTTAAALRLASTAEAESWLPFVWGAQAQTAGVRGNHLLARDLINKAFAGQNLNQTTMTFRELHKVAYQIFSKTGDTDNALSHLEAFKRLDDEARELKASTNAALMSSRFDFANQELRIANLKAGQLKRDFELAKSNARIDAMKLYGLYGALGVVCLLLFGAIVSILGIRRSRNEVRDANSTLRRVNSELEQALSVKTRFLATTSHEIRTPLNGILGMTQIMLQDRTLHDEHRDRVRIVHEAGTTMKALVDDILDLAKMETGKVTLEDGDVELKQLLEGVARLWIGQAAKKGLGLTIDLDCCPSSVRGDARRLRQIVFNLMSNAVKFTAEGSVTLAATAGGDTYVIEVRDTGIGIPENEQKAVFDSFHQVDGGMNRQYGGTGLGLAICRDLVEAMGGRIDLESQTGRGSTFKVVLPLNRASCSTSGAADEAPWPKTISSARILFVENNPLTRSLMAAALKDQVGHIDTVPAAEAEARIRERSHHHYLIDLVSCDGDPALLLEALHHEPGRKRAVTLLTTSALEPAVYARYLRLGVRQILQRPISAEALISRLEELHEQIGIEIGAPPPGESWPEKAVA